MHLLLMVIKLFLAGALIGVSISAGFLMILAKKIDDYVDRLIDALIASEHD